MSRLAMAVALSVAALVSANAATPGNVFACYCVPPETVAAYRTDADIVIVAGRLTGPATFRVERVYKGPIAFGDNDILIDTSSCGFPMQKGERWIMAARLFKGELRPSLCESRARADGPGAAALLADIESAYGAQPPLAAPAESAPGIVVDPAPAEPTARPAAPVQASLPQGGDPIQLAIIVGAPFVGIILILLIASVFRRRSDESEAA